MLETEKSSSHQNLDSIVELATEQNICAREKYEELYKELLNAREEARIACEQLTAKESVRTLNEGNPDSMAKILMEVWEVMLEVQDLRDLVESVPSFVDELFQSFSVIPKLFLDLNSLLCSDSVKLKSIFSDYEKLHCSMRHKITELESEKLLLHNQSSNLHKQIEDLKQDAQNYENSLRALSEEQDAERSEFLSQIRALDQEILCLSSCSLAREKESLRKDFEKTKTKLRENEFKLKNVIQEKTKLEGEKAFAEREIKQLQKKAFLERDISKRDSLAGRRRDSAVDRSSKVFDPKRAKGCAVSFEQTMQEEYKKLEVLAFEMETTIASLEEELAAAYGEKEEAISRNISLASELDDLSDQLNISQSQLNMLQEEVSSLRLKLEESELSNQKMESTVNMLVEEKEELGMQLTHALLDMEEEKAIWSAKEKVSVEAIEERAKSFNAEILLLSERMSEVTNELESCREECKLLGKRLTCSEENAKKEKQCSMEKSLEIDRLRNDQEMADLESKKSVDILKSNFETLSLEHHHACEEVDKLQKELSFLNKDTGDLPIQFTELDTGSNLANEFQSLKNQLLIMTSERDKLMTQIEEQGSHVVDAEIIKRIYDDQLLEAKFQVEELNGRISSLEIKMHNDEIDNSKQKAKLRMRLHWTQAKLDAFCGRYKEVVNEMDFMKKKYEEAAGKLKDMLASKGIEVLNLKKQLAAVKEQ